MNFAEFKPLDLKKSGPDLNEFLRLITDALETRESGSALKINAQQMSAMLANGSLGGCLAVANGIPVGLQVWESGGFWFDTRPLHALRIQYLAPEFNTQMNHVQFLQRGNRHFKDTSPDARVLNMVADVDLPTSIVPNCGLKIFATAYAA